MAGCEPAFSQEDEMERIVRNAIECVLCGAVVESRHRHDFAMHVCRGLIVRRGPDGFIAADGGKDYLRRCGDPADFEDVSEFMLEK